MPRKILILSASAGAGHTRAGQALERAFAERDPAIEVTHADALEYTNSLFRRLYAKAYLDLVGHSPELLGWMYDYLDEPWKHERRRLAMDKLNTRPLTSLIKKLEPDYILCTHFLPAEIVSWLKAKQKIATPHAVVVTDFDMHAMWLCRHCEDYFVAIDETREHLQRLGVAADHIHVSGIPIDPAFATPSPRPAARAALGLHEELPTLLISAGGFGVGPIDHLVEALMTMTVPAQVLMMCGKNEELRERLSTKVSSARSVVTFQMVGFTTRMQDYMSAADILVGKPGGLTTSEALAKGLAFVIVNPIPGQEERNSDHLLEQGIAIRCNNLPVLGWKIDALLRDPERLRGMQERARKLSRPEAAATIVDFVLRS